MLFSINLQEYTSATCFFSACRYSPSNLHPQLAFSLSCRYSPAKICIRNLLFLYLADTLLQKYASATSLFSILQILPCKNLHPQLAFSLSCRYSPSKICIRNFPFLYLADTPLQKLASATSLFSILQILSFKNLHPQLAFSLSCRYSPVPTHSSIKLLWIFTELLF